MAEEEKTSFKMDIRAELQLVIMERDSLRSHAMLLGHNLAMYEDHAVKQAQVVKDLEAKLEQMRSDYAALEATLSSAGRGLPAGGEQASLLQAALGATEQ